MIGKYRDQRLSELMDAYDKGLYQKQEVISVCIDLLVERAIRSDLWSELPGWVSSAIQQRLTNFDGSDELVSFGHADPALVKKKMLQLQQWLQSRQSQ
jgi:hypothetical protein